MIPDSVVLSAAIVPLRERDPVDLKVRIGAGIRPSHVQAILDERVGTPTRSEPLGDGPSVELRRDCELEALHELTRWAIEHKVRLIG